MELELECVKAELSNNEAVFETEKKEKESLQRSLDFQKSRAECFRASLGEAEEKLRDKESNARTESKKLGDLRNELETTKRQMNQMETFHEQRGKESEILLKKLEAENAQLRQVIELELANKISQEDTLQQRDGELERYKTHIQTISLALSNQRNETEKLREKNEALATEIDELKEENNVLTAVRELSENEYSATRQKNSELAKELESLLAETQTLRAKIERLESENRAREAKLLEKPNPIWTKAELEKENATLRSRVAGKDFTIMCLKHEVKDLKRKLHG